MVDLPASVRGVRTPIVPTKEKVVNLSRLQDESLAMSMYTTINPEALQIDLEAGVRTTSDQVRAMVNQSVPSSNRIVEESQQQGIPPEQALDRIYNQQTKEMEWKSTQGNIYLDQILALNDPEATAELSRFSTNLQIGQEIIESRMNRVSEENSIVGMAAGWIDRELFRYTVIGIWETLTNRNERKGLELLNAASTMSPEDYTKYITQYVDEVGREGFFDRDNYQAYQQALFEHQNFGEDPDEVFNRSVAALELIPLFKGLSTGGRTIARSTTALTRVGARQGVEAATDAGETLVRSGSTDPTVLTDMGPSALSPARSGPVRPTISRSADMAEENSILRGLQHLNDTDFLGHGVTSSSVREAADIIIAGINRSINRPIADIRPPVSKDLTGGYILDVDIGTLKNGTPYKTRRAAEKQLPKLQEESPTARVRQVDPDDTKKGFYLNVTERLDTGATAPELSQQSMLGPIKRIYAGLLGSKATVENRLLNDLAINAEGGLSAIGKLIRPQLKLLNSMSVKSKDTMSDIYSELRDGADAFLRKSYTDDEITSKFKDRTGVSPTEKEIQAFRALQDINDASWMMRAHSRLQKYIERGYYALVTKNGDNVAGKVVNDVPRTELVTDLSTNTTVRLGDVSGKVKVWKLDRPLEGGNEYVIRPNEVKILSPEDVLGYNAGGRRINPDANYFVTSGTDRPRAFLAAFSESQARDAVNFFAGVKKIIDDAGGTDLITDSRLMDEFISENNDWNPGVQNWSDLQDFAKAKGFSLTEDVNFKVRDGEIQTGEVTNDFEDTWGEYVTFGMHRSDDVLTEYGGAEARQRDPVAAIFEDFSTTANHYAHNLITQQGIHGWVKAASRKGSGWNVPAGNDPRKRYMAATQVESGNSAATELATQRSILNNRMRVKSDIQKKMENFGAGARDYIFDNSKGKVRTGNDFGLPGAQNKLLSLGFQSAFGFFNMSQLLVQGFHAPVIAAMAPKHGLKGLAMMPAVRLALMTDDVATETLAVKRLASVTGLEELDSQELLDFIHTSGRNIINESALENGTATQWGLDGWKGESALPSSLRAAQATGARVVRGALDVGTIAFKEGDRAARLTAINTAFLEFKAKYPGMSALSEFGRREIRRREEALTLRMTNVNRAKIQEGFMKLPTQWWSHSLRVLEGVVLGRDLTGAERARMVGMYTAMFGMTGFGVGKFTNYVSEKMGAEAASPVHTLIKYGLIDAMLDATMDVELALGQRMAPINLFLDVFKDIEGNKSPMEMALGPSGDISAGFTNAIASAVGDIVHGNTTSAMNDVVRTMRNFSGIDNVNKAYGILRYGTYRTRTGRTVPGEYTTSDAIGQLLGFTPAEVNTWYQDVKQFEYNNSVKVKDFTDMMLVDFNSAMDSFDSNDDERGLQILREIAIRIDASNLSEYDKMSVRRNMRVAMDDGISRSVEYRLMRDHEYAAINIERTFRGE